MTTTPHIRMYGHVMVAIYYMDAGDNIGRHQHNIPHKTRVIVGASRVDIFDNPHITIRMRFDDPEVTLPPFLDHEITAIENGTVVMNVTLLDAAAGSPPPQTQAGVTTDCGCVVPSPP